MNKTTNITYENISISDNLLPIPSNPKEFDSNEEIYFSWMLNELESEGYIKHWGRAGSFELMPTIKHNRKQQMQTKEKISSFNLLTGHVYTPDFSIIWDPAAEDVFYSCLSSMHPVKKDIPFFANHYNEEHVSLIEIKPMFSAHNRGAKTNIDIKMVYALKGIYIQLVKIGNKSNSFFAKTFTPKQFLLTDKTSKPRKLHYRPQNLKEFVGEL